jgi:hypothetical protein
MRPGAVGTGSLKGRLAQRLRQAAWVHSIFGKLGLPPGEADNRRVLAVMRYLGS